MVSAAGALAAVAIGTAPAQAAATTHTEHGSFPAAGAVFTCTGGDLTATAGTVYSVLHTTVDNQGVFHVTGTITPRGVTLQDAAGNTYTLSGASWFGGKSVTQDESGIIVSTDTSHFVIHSSTGGVYAKVQMVEHVSPNGTSFSFVRGSCQEPQN